ncbi:DUF2946 family protein [Bradyrhizobium lupini]|uniref:DUF2946 family protein n=1 Tax=Rhizobium lupini TaxID=136996 RepID=UPI0034C62A2B
MQVLAPIAACLAAGQAVADPLSAAVICHSAGEQGGLNDPAGTPVAHAGTCALCCLAQVGASPDRRRTPHSPFPCATPSAWCGTRRRHSPARPIRVQTPRRAPRLNFPDDSRDRRGPPQAIDAVEWPERKPGVRNAPCYVVMPALA